jgi:four helix bundle protein
VWLFVVWSIEEAERLMIGDCRLPIADLPSRSGLAETMDRWRESLVNDKPPVSKTVIMQARAKAFAFDVLRIVRTLPQSLEGRLLGRQLLRSGMSVAANYRAACRARSRAEFIAKIGTVVEEADETMFWLEALTELSILKNATVGRALRECNELVSIFVASRITAQRRALNRQSAIGNRQ